MTTLDCFTCGRSLEPALPRDLGVVNQPYGATVFTTHGQYGSTVFDPENGDFLELNICDACLIVKAARVLHGRVQRIPESVSYTEWVPPRGEHDVD